MIVLKLNHSNNLTILYIILTLNHVSKLIICRSICYHHDSIFVKCAVSENIWKYNLLRTNEDSCLQTKIRHSWNNYFRVRDLYHYTYLHSNCWKVQSKHCIAFVIFFSTYSQLLFSWVECSRNSFIHNLLNRSSIHLQLVNFSSSNSST